MTAGRPRERHLAADVVALAAVLVAVLGWLGVGCGVGMAVTGRDSPEGMAGFAAYFWLVLVGPVAVLSTTIAALALHRRGSGGPAAAFGLLALAGAVGLVILALTA